MKTKKEMLRISHLEFEKGFDYIEYIKEFNKSPTIINLIADSFPSKYEKNKFIIDSVFVNIESLKESFPNTIINVDDKIASIAYLFEVL